LQSIEYLWLPDTQITDEGLEELAKLQKLEVLGLTNTQITDTGLKDVAKLQKLEGLYLIGTKVTDTGVTELKKAVANCKIEGPQSFPQNSLSALASLQKGWTIEGGGEG